MLGYHWPSEDCQKGYCLLSDGIVCEYLKPWGVKARIRQDYCKIKSEHPELTKQYWYIGIYLLTVFKLNLIESWTQSLGIKFKCFEKSQWKVRFLFFPPPIACMFSSVSQLLLQSSRDNVSIYMLHTHIFKCDSSFIYTLFRVFFSLNSCVLDLSILKRKNIPH